MIFPRTAPSQETYKIAAKEPGFYTQGILFAKKGIDYLGVHYTAVEHSPPIYSAELAEYQLGLINTIMRNEQASYLLSLTQMKSEFSKPMSSKINSSRNQVRAAIDFGSGAIKIQMGIVDTQDNLLVDQPLLAKYIPLSLTEDVATHSGRISDKMEQQAFSILEDFKENALTIAKDKGAQTVQFAGVATAVFRKASNGVDILNKFEKNLGIRFQILSQEEEGELGFMTAKALYPNVSMQNLLAWDSGNGSFQMTSLKDENYKVYQGPLGHGTVRVLLSKDIRNGPILEQKQYGNPVFKQEALLLSKKIKALLPEIPSWLEEKIASEDTRIVTFGDGEAIFALVAQALVGLQGIKAPVQHAIISISDVQKVLDVYLEKGDEVFDNAGIHRKTLTSALLLSTIMEHFRISKIYYKRSMGNTAGMLVNPELWQ